MAFDIGITNKGRLLLAKAQTGIKLNFNRIAVGDGYLSGQQPAALNALVNQKKSLPIATMKVQANGSSLLRCVMSNQDMTTGFYFREIGVFAQDPDVGEILYCYGNIGDGAEYIDAGSGSEILEKTIDVITIIGNATNVTATIDSSLAYATYADLNEHKTAATLDHPDGCVTDAKIGSRTIVDTAAPAGDAGMLTTLFGWLANMIKSVTGEATWRTAPGMTIKAIKAVLDAATAAATASTLLKRDGNGRAKVAAPSAADDIARKDTVDNTVSTHAAVAASSTTAGHVKLVNATNSTSTTDAPTAAAVKAAYDRANEAFQSASNGKSAVAAAITGMGQSASGSDTFDTLAGKISAISSDATAGNGDVLSGRTFYSGGKKTGAMNNYSGQQFQYYSSNITKWEDNGAGYGRIYFPLRHQGGTINGYVNDNPGFVDIQNLLPGNIRAGVTMGSDSNAAGKVTGTFTNDATASSGDIRNGKTAYVNGAKLTGNMVSWGSSTGSSTLAEAPGGSTNYFSVTGLPSTVRLVEITITSSHEPNDIKFIIAPSGVGTIRDNLSPYLVPSGSLTDTGFNASILQQNNYGSGTITWTWTAYYSS